MISGGPMRIILDDDDDSFTFSISINWMGLKMQQNRLFCFFKVTVVLE